MRNRQIHESNGQRTFVLVLEPGEEASTAWEAFARQEHMTAAQISAIGAFTSSVLGFWNGERHDDDRHPVDEQTGVLSLIGAVSEGEDGKPQVHLHAVLGRSDATTLGGHFLEGHVHPALEVILTESPTHLRRVYDPRAGLAVITGMT